MNKSVILFLIVIIAVFTSIQAQTHVDPKIPDLLASERENLPVDGELLYDCADLGAYNMNGGSATKQIVEADTASEFGLQFHIKVLKAGNNAWEPQLLTPLNDIPVNTGDVLLYVFFIRTTDTESPNDFGKSDFFVQKASSPWNGIGSLSMSLSTTWTKHYVIAESNVDFGIGEMTGTFHLGFLQQEVEVGGMLALNLGDVDVDSLPTNDVVYEGMEPDAAWRAEAEARIEQHRKSDIQVKVTDGEGKVVDNANISIKMKKHDFGFGNFISGLVLDNTTDGNNYRSHQKEMFNVATTPFYMGGSGDDWGWYGPGDEQTRYPAMAGWLQENKIPAKGHVLVWPGWDWMPSFFEDLKGDPDGLRSAIDDHLETLVPIGKENGLYEWDVVNEPYINHDVMDILGEDILINWYNKVHEMDRFPRLILNEYNIIMGGGNPAFQANFERIIEYIQGACPLGGIGMQCHFDENLTGITQVLEILDRFSVYGLPIQITEFDVAIRDENIQAAYLRDFYTAVYSHPSTDKIVMWGFYEKVMWKPLGALVRNDWTHKPNYDVYMDLLYDQWWTPEAVGVTDGSGEFDLRGFNGYYDISVVIGDSTYIMEDRLINRDTILKLQPSSFDPTGIVFSDDISGAVLSYPNPCTNHVVLSYSLVSPAEITFQFYSMSGELVKSDVVDHAAPGPHSTAFDMGHLPPGMYMCVVDSKIPNSLRTSLRILKE